MFEAHDDDAVQVSVGGKSGRSVGLGFFVDPTPDDELEGVEEVFEARPFGQLIGGGLALAVGGAGVGSLLLPILGEDLLWLVAGALLLTVGVVSFRKAIRIRPRRILVYPDRLVFHRFGDVHEYFWSEVSHAEIVVLPGDSLVHELRLHLRHPTDRLSPVEVADERGYATESFSRLSEAIQKHCEVKLPALTI